MRKLISSAMAVAAIGALTAPAYAADATKSGAVKIVEQPSTVASHDGKLTTAAKGKFLGGGVKSNTTKSADHKYKQAIPNKSDYLKTN
jgi:hypothetical protein